MLGFLHGGPTEPANRNSDAGALECPPVGLLAFGCLAEG